MTRGYDANRSGKGARGDANMSIDPAAKGNLWSDCKNKTAANRPVVGHNPGDPICPKVQAKMSPQHPKWDSVMKTHTHSEHLISKLSIREPKVRERGGVVLPDLLMAEKVDIDVMIRKDVFRHT